MNSYVLGFLVMLTTSALAVGGMLVVWRIVGVEKLKSFNEVAGNSFQVVGTFYAVLLCLIVVDAMTDMSDLRCVVEQEANAVADVYILSRGLPEAPQKKIQELASSYVDTVIDDEWPAMKQGRVSTKAIVQVNELWNTIIDFKPTADDQKDIRNICLDRVSELGDSRRSRLITSSHGVSAELWTVLVIGGVLTLGFSYFLGLSSVIGQTLMTIVIASTLALNVYLVFLFGYPFSGAYCVEPEAFMVDRLIFSLRSTSKGALPDVKSINPRDLLKSRGKL
ncbi:MAG TPA: DUF4239 domain-containing protein [Candidatus Melainabacteria bacterium]|nr:DUF4239 domain-containing protein [Candidatus Melainabacteria bacterium]HIN63692.1 DUF4239 domain-containing protein [Candidatus Obscuribacterales bacterium]